MNARYILNADGKPVSEPDLVAWARWYEAADRHVARDQVGDVNISTVFLGIDHSFGRPGGPVLWETMVFGGRLDQDQERCSGSREQAEAMHARMVEAVMRAQAGDRV